ARGARCRTRAPRRARARCDEPAGCERSPAPRARRDRRSRRCGRTRDPWNTRSVLSILAMSFQFLGALAAFTVFAFTGQHDHRPEKLGSVHFQTSCVATAQPHIDRAVALLHSFDFGRAIDGFNAALREDPACVIAYWGIALSRWSNPFAAGVKSPAQLQLGRDAIVKTETIASGTTRERDYVAAAAKLYADFERTPQPVRVAAYREAMAGV